MALGTAFKAFFAVLRGGPSGEAIREVLLGGGSRLLGGPEKPATLEAGKQQEKPPQGTKGEKVSSRRSDALTLLSALQREARLVDLVQEPLDQFTDAQVGAAARPCLKQCQQVLDRMFALAPVVQGEEGSAIEVPDTAGPLRVQWVGSPPSGNSRGTLLHHGWEANRCEVATWTGEDADAKIIAPAQVQS